MDERVVEKIVEKMDEKIGNKVVEIMAKNLVEKWFKK